MPDLATKSDAAAPQREGTAVTFVTKQGHVHKHGGRDVPDDDQHGITVASARWGGRSMGNGGPVT